MPKVWRDAEEKWGQWFERTPPILKPVMMIWIGLMAIPVFLFISAQWAMGYYECMDCNGQRNVFKEPKRNYREYQGRRHDPVCQSCHQKGLEKVKTDKIAYDIKREEMEQEAKKKREEEANKKWAHVLNR